MNRPLLLGVFFLLQTLLAAAKRPHGPHCNGLTCLAAGGALWFLWRPPLRRAWPWLLLVLGAWEGLTNHCSRLLAEQGQTVPAHHDPRQVSDGLAILHGKMLSQSDQPLALRSCAHSVLAFKWTA